MRIFIAHAQHWAMSLAHRCEGARATNRAFPDLCVLPATSPILRRSDRNSAPAAAPNRLKNQSFVARRHGRLRQRLIAN
jgi:hypothetical protein